MSSLIDNSAQLAFRSLCKIRPGAAVSFDMVRFRDTGVPCWRCTGNLEYYYCESGIFALRCSQGCEGVYLVSAISPRKASDKIAGTYVGEIPGGGVPGAAD